jgi:hypothetical protein
LPDQYQRFRFITKNGSIEIRGRGVLGRINFGLILIIAVTSFAVTVNIDIDNVRSEGDKRDIHYAPLDCRPLDSYEKNDTIPAPIVQPLPAYTPDYSSIICWEPVQHNDVAACYVVASLVNSFDVITTCALKDDSVLCERITVELEARIWYLAFFIDTNGRIGPPSDTLWTIQDVSAPEIENFAVRDPGTGDEDYTPSRNVEVIFDGNDLWGGRITSTCTTLVVWESPGRYNEVNFDLTSCAGTVQYTLSPQPGKKTVCGELVDKAGNRSEEMCDEITLIIGSYNYPNPFNPRKGSTHVVFWLDKPGRVNVSIYNLLGELVLERSISRGAGMNEFEWDGMNGNGEFVSNGGYVCIVDRGSGEPYKYKIAVLKK